jgi:hypothetical protein
MNKICLRPKCGKKAVEPHGYCRGCTRKYYGQGAYRYQSAPLRFGTGGGRLAPRIAGSETGWNGTDRYRAFPNDIGE